MEGFFQTGSALIASAEGGHLGTSYWGLAAYLAFTLAIIAVLMTYGLRGLNGRVFKNPITNCFEQLYLFVEGMCINIIGTHGRKYIPFIFTLWTVIFVGNVVALFFSSSPTADLSFNFAMALIAVSYVQYEGMKANGVFGHIKHFAGPKLKGLLVVISGMIFIIEVVSELMKNISLPLRLYGNINGGHQAVEAMNKLGEGILVPVGAFLLPIKALTCVLQALIFTLLTCVYISLVTHHEEPDSDEYGHSAGSAIAH